MFSRRPLKEKRAGGSERLQIFSRWAERPQEVASQKLVGAVQAHRHVGAGDVEFLRDLGDGTLVEVAHPHDIGVRRRQVVNGLQQDAHKLPPVERLVKVRRDPGGLVGP